MEMVITGREGCEEGVLFLLCEVWLVGPDAAFW